MRGRRAGRKSLRERLEANHRALSFYAQGFGHDAPQKPAKLLELEAKAAARKPRAAPGASGKPLERNVLKEVIAALKADPRVSRVERNVSGSFVQGNSYVTVGAKGKLDLTVYLVDGRYAEIEVKRSPHVHLLRPGQLERIKSIRASGGIAGWCWNAASAIALLP